MPDNPEERFRSHKHYVEALAWIGGRSMLTQNRKALGLLAGRAQAAGVGADAPPARFDTAQVHRSLRNAWSTELLLGLPSQWTDEDEFIRLSNTWGVIQAYYVGYHQTQALWVAKGNARPSTHPKTQQLYATLWADRPLDLPPWSMGIGYGGWRNVPADKNIDLTVHSWSGCNNKTCWSLAGKVLKSTGDEKVAAARSDKRDAGQRSRRKDWDLEEDLRLAAGKKPRKKPGAFPRPQLTGAQKDACDKAVRTYTLLDYLWRLRVNANYDDAAVFMDGPDNDIDSFHVHQRMTYLASGLSLLTEMRVRDLVGAKRLRRWTDDFIAKSIPSPYSLSVKERRPYL